MPRTSASATSATAAVYGYYRNFERCLELVPPGVRLVALSDQDDVWHADKLETLARAFRSERVQLAYADMRIVTADGEAVAPSYWTDRANNHTDLPSLLLIDTVTGAASALPAVSSSTSPCRFPMYRARPFTTTGSPASHSRSATSRSSTARSTTMSSMATTSSVATSRSRASCEAVSSTLFADSPATRVRLRNTIQWARRDYEDEVAVREAFARALRERLNGRIDPKAASAIDKVADLSSSTRSLLWLLGRSARDVRGDSPTLGIENQLIKGILWHRLHRGRASAANRQ